MTATVQAMPMAHTGPRLRSELSWPKVRVSKARMTAHSDWKDGFLFVGNEPVLDFVNTRPVVDGEPVELLKDFGALTRWFQAAGPLSGEEAGVLRRSWEGTERAEKTTQAMRELRERLRSEITRWERTGKVRQAAIDELNELLAKHPMRMRLNSRGRTYSTEQWFEAREPEDLFAPLRSRFLKGRRGRSASAIVLSTEWHFCRHLFGGR